MIWFGLAWKDLSLCKGAWHGYLNVRLSRRYPRFECEQSASSIQKQDCFHQGTLFFCHLAFIAARKVSKFCHNAIISSVCVMLGVGCRLLFVYVKCWKTRCIMKIFFKSLNIKLNMEALITGLHSTFPVLHILHYELRWLPGTMLTTNWLSGGKTTMAKLMLVSCADCNT